MLCNYLDAVGVERCGEEHVEKKQLSHDVDEVEQLDKDVDDDQVVTAAMEADRTMNSTTTATSFHLVTAAEAAQISTANPHIPVSQMCFTSTLKLVGIYPCHDKNASAWFLDTV